MHHTRKPDPVNLLGWEDRMLQEQGWKQRSYGSEKKAGSKVLSKQ